MLFEMVMESFLPDWFKNMEGIKDGEYIGALVEKMGVLGAIESVLVILVMLAISVIFVTFVRFVPISDLSE